MVRRKTAGPKAARKKANRTSRASRAAAPAVAARPRTATPARVEAARRKFEDGVLARREAVKRGQPLPPGATHEITGRSESGRPVLKRKRFSAR